MVIYGEEFEVSREWTCSGVLSVCVGCGFFFGVFFVLICFLWSEDGMGWGWVVR